MTDMLKNYQYFQKSTEKKEFDLKYMAIGWAGEVGEVLNEIKKIERDDNGLLTDSKKNILIEELGDSMWYLSGICNRLGCNIEDIIKSNKIKLSKKHDDKDMGNYSKRNTTCCGT